jgi:hypothetical protein
MSRRARDLGLGAVLFVVALAGALWQVDQAGALGQSAEGKDVSLPRLICPLH